jgi:hypothetical protein
MSIFKPHQIQDNETIKTHRVNRRADRGLEEVTKTMEEALGIRCREVERSLLRRELMLDDVEGLTSLRLDYTQYQNRLWAVTYDLRVRVEEQVDPEEEHETEYCRFISKTRGRTKVRSAEWMDGGSSCNEERIKSYLGRLRNKLIMDRIMNLDLHDIVAEYDPAKKIRRVEFRSPIGSYNWVLIPPVRQLIKPRPEECAQMVEFSQLVIKTMSMDPEERRV